MKIVITANEAIDMGIFEEVCDMKGISVWVVNEGMMESDEEIVFTKDQAIELGIIERGI